MLTREQIENAVIDVNVREGNVYVTRSEEFRALALSALAEPWQAKSLEVDTNSEEFISNFNRISVQFSTSTGGTITGARVWYQGKLTELTPVLPASPAGRKE